jgi:hypothetical protein
VDKHFRDASGGGWEASVHVCCDVDSYDVSLKYVTDHPRLYGAFGAHFFRFSPSLHHRFK